MSGRVGVAQSNSASLRVERVESPALWVAMAREMRNRQGMSYQAIADALGKPYRRVYVALNQDRVREWNAKAPSAHKDVKTAQRRASRLAAAPECTVCGEKLSKPPKVLPAVCGDCRHGAGGWRPEPPEWWFEALDLWVEGVEVPEIAQRLGKEETQVYNTFSTLRRRGWIIPYHAQVRYALARGERPKLEAPSSLGP